MYQYHIKNFTIVLLALLVLSTQQVRATTTAAEATATATQTQTQNAPTTCTWTAHFTGASHHTINGTFRGGNYTEHKVYWHFSHASATGDNLNRAVCVAAQQNLVVRVRAGDVATLNPAPQYTYSVDFNEPQTGARVTITAQLLSGRDSRSGQSYSEWTLQGTPR